MALFLRPRRSLSDLEWRTSCANSVSYGPVRRRTHGDCPLGRGATTFEHRSSIKALAWRFFLRSVWWQRRTLAGKKDPGARRDSIAAMEICRPRIDAGGRRIQGKDENEVGAGSSHQVHFTKKGRDEYLFQTHSRGILDSPLFGPSRNALISERTRRWIYFFEPVARGEGLPYSPRDSGSRGVLGAEDWGSLPLS